ncbi:hypothetical protein [Paraburkholderia caribensis]|uniref:hypothetical protein n=1 Tax=Paraburkholderia caribensis TaxID=75105 RepID=UPI00159147D4|nr:hypothetical protein [Paraburkholderia caribensis]
MTTKISDQQATSSLQRSDADRLILPNYYRHYSTDSLPQTAMDLVRKLIDLYASGPHFYANLDGAILSTWLEEDFPEIVAGLKQEGQFASFQQSLEFYCERLSVAGALADTFLNETLNYEQDDFWDFDVERFFPGLHRRIQLGEVRKLEELPPIIATLVDRFTRVQGIPLRANNRIHLHSYLSDEAWDWFDLPQVKAGGNKTAYLLRKEHFSIYLSAHTNERYALVLNAPQGRSSSALICRTSHHEVGPAITEARKVIAEIRFSEYVPAIPFFDNLPTLKLFRQHIPVVYLFDDAPALLVEYPFSWMADSPWFTREALRIEETYSPQDITWDADALINKIRSMPLGPGPVKRKSVFNGPFNDSWPEFPYL